jgi:hypothetical protein
MATSRSCACLLTCSLLSLTFAPVGAARDIERQLERSFRVAAGSVVVVDITGGSITATEGASGSVELTLTQRVRGADSDREADEILAEFDVDASQRGDTISLVARKRDRNTGNRGWRRGVSFSATLAVPSNVRLDLHTSGGSIAVRGERTAEVDADTSGGSITVDGGRGPMRLNTSGGRIGVTEALASLVAETSGGGITVDYVGPAAKDVSLDTSGGSIRVGIDPEARLDVSARTSGGRVSIDGLELATQRLRPSQARGALNGGGGRLSASTSGGNIEIRAARR